MGKQSRRVRKPNGKQGRRQRQRQHQVSPTKQQSSCVHKNHLAAKKELLGLQKDQEQHGATDDHFNREQMDRLMLEFNANQEQQQQQQNRKNTYMRYGELLEKIDSKLYTHQDYTFLKQTSQMLNDDDKDALFYRVSSWMYLAGIL